MVGKRIPLFNRGNILTKEMLDALKDYAVRSSELAYVGYSDGILKGCNITTKDNLITINKGILIFNETAYYIHEPISIDYKPSNEWLVLKVSLQGESVTENFISRDIDIILTNDDSQLGHEDVEICRFKLQTGARLRYKYKDFSDMNTMYDTVNIIHSKWAAYGNTSVSPIILRSFLAEALQYPINDSLDKVFCQEIASLKGETINREAISIYICNKTQKDYKLCNNTEIYQGLKEALKLIKGEKVEVNKNIRRKRRIIVD